MDYIFDNPLANLPGVYFLYLYASVITVAAVAFQIVKRQFDTTARLPLPPIPTNPDVYEIAFLRGGENELARSVIFALTQRGFLEVQTSGESAWVQQAEVKPDKQTLNYLEQKVYDYFWKSYQTREIFAAQNGLKEIIKPFAATYSQRLENSNLLTAPEIKSRVLSLKWMMMLGVLALGGYKLLAAIAVGRSNIGFLIALSVVAFVIFAVMKGLPRISAHGRVYLGRLEQAFESLKWQIKKPLPTSPQQQFAGGGAAFNSIDPMLLAVGVFGASALAGTSYDSYHQAFHKAQQQNPAGGGCGAGCGSSWDSSSSSSSSSSCSSGSDGGGSSCSGGSSCGGGGGCGGCGGS